MQGSVCTCGRSHGVTTRTDIGAGVLVRLGQSVAELTLTGPALLVADGNTWQAAGPAVERALTEAGVPCSRHIFPAGELHTDEHTVGSVLMALDDRVRLIVAVASPLPSGWANAG